MFDCSLSNPDPDIFSPLPQRRRWLQEALTSIASSPSETQLLQTAIAVLQVCIVTT